MPDIRDYYRKALERIKQEIESTDEGKVLGYNLDSWVRSLVDQWALDPIQADQTRAEDVVEIAGSETRVIYRLPVVPSNTIEIIHREKLTAGTITYSIPPSSHLYDRNGGGWLALICEGSEHGVKQAKSHYQNQVSWWNHDIDVQNQDFPGSIKNVIQNRINRIGAKNQRLTEMVAKTGIKLRKKTDVEEVIPVAVSTRKQVTPILQRETNGGERVVLVPETLDAILHLVDCQGRQFERTPTVFSRLGEEDLRDILLSSLNAVFEGQAVGEAFDVLGKSDIHLRISKGEVFIAECKWWEGPESLKTAHQQLLERLTWHESNGAVIIFCKNTGFSSTLETWKLAIPKLAGARGQMVKKTENQVSQRFCLPGDLGTEVEVRFLIYNLYLPRPSGRSKA